MVDIIKQDMTYIWASSGDITAPDPSKIAAGWVVEAVPRQWWNWFENRQDVNIAYMLQKGLPEWDVDTEYLTNKSYVQRNGVVYKCILTNTNTDPATTPANWVKAFPESSASLEAIRAVTPVADTFVYFTSPTAAATSSVTAFMRTLMDDVDAATARTTLQAQLASAVLTTLATLSPATNKLPYFTGTTTVTTTDLTAFARTLLDDSDAATARSTLGVDSSTDAAAALAAGLATKQPLNALLTSVSALNPAANQMIYYTANNTGAVTALTAFARSILDDADAVTVRTTIGANDAANLTTGTLDLARLPATLTGKNAATATALQTPRTIQGVAFDGTANITLSVVDKDSSIGAAAIPAGTTAQRPANGAGKFRFNTDTSRAEINNGTAWGSLGGASGGGNDSVFYLNDQNVTANFTVPAGQNAMSAGPITIANGVTVTVSDGSVWTIV